MKSKRCRKEAELRIEPIAELSPDEALRELADILVEWHRRALRSGGGGLPYREGTLDCTSIPDIDASADSES